MGKTAARNANTTGTPRVDEELELLAAAAAAKQQFFAATLNMSWRLALTVVIPVVLGVKLDEYFNSSPSLTLTGFFIAVAAGASAVWTTVKEVNQQQADEAARQTKKPRRKTPRA